MGPRSPEQQEPEFSPTIQVIIQVAILIAIVAMCLETVPELEIYAPWFNALEIVLVALFTVEYFARWRMASNKYSYPFRFMALIDLAAVLPFYLSLGYDLRGLRALRILRVFRILKLARYNRAIQMLGDAFQKTAPELLTFGVIASIIILLSAMAIYYAENATQPEVFSSIPASLWWAVVTLTTVGYGDAYPQTLVGKCVAAVVMITGIGMVAVPTGLISSAMTEIIRERREAESE